MSRYSSAPEFGLKEMPGIDFYSLVAQTKSMMKEPLKYNLHVYTPNEYAQMRCFAYTYGPRAAGYAIMPGGTLVNVFSLVQGRGDQIVRHAIEQGARRLDCYDGHLVQLYRRHGFVEVNRIPWDWEYADPRWKAEWGTPDVVEMEYRP